MQGINPSLRCVSDIEKQPAHIFGKRLIFVFGIQNKDAGISRIHEREQIFGKERLPLPRFSENNAVAVYVIAPALPNIEDHGIIVAAEHVSFRIQNGRKHKREYRRKRIGIDPALERFQLRAARHGRFCKPFELPA